MLNRSGLTIHARARDGTLTMADLDAARVKFIIGLGPSPTAQQLVQPTYTPLELRISFAVQSTQTKTHHTLNTLDGAKRYVVLSCFIYLLRHGSSCGSYVFFFRV